MADKPFTPRKVINIHAHIDKDEDVDKKVALWKQQGAVRTCVLCTSHPSGEPNWGFMGNDGLAPWIERYPDHLVGFGGLNLSQPPDAPSVVGELRAKGFTGLKCIMPARPYDDDAYLPFFEAAAKYRMPILFHTGFLSFPAGYRGPGTVDVMRPSRLERIARYFPDLPLIGAHLGVGFEREAVKLALSRPNVHFDISGGGAKPLHGSFMKKALASFPGADMTSPEEHFALQLFKDKLLFGTDGASVEQWVVRAEDIMDSLQIPADIRENFYWKTAAKILGV